MNGLTSRLVRVRVDRRPSFSACQEVATWAGRNAYPFCSFCHPRCRLVRYEK